MKNNKLSKLVLLMLLIIIGGSLKAQVEFAPVGAEWYYERQIFNYENWCYDGITYDRFRSLDVKDINGWQCKEIELFKNVDCDGNVNPSYETRYINQEGDKIYEVIDGERHLLYDFSKQVGEYWLVKHNSEYIDGIDTIFVKEIKETTLADGNTRRMFVTSSNGTTESMLYCTNIIEGIGMDKSVFPFYELMGPPPCKQGDIRCYSIDENYLITSDTECDYEKPLLINELVSEYVAINTVVVNNLEIFFNEDNHCIKNIDIYSMTGKLVYKSESLDNSFYIDLSNQTNGIYFVKINTNNYYQTYKIIKI